MHVKDKANGLFLKKEYLPPRAANTPRLPVCPLRLHNTHLPDPQPILIPIPIFHLKRLLRSSPRQTLTRPELKQSQGYPDRPPRLGELPERGEPERGKVVPDITRGGRAERQAFEARAQCGYLFWYRCGRESEEEVVKLVVKGYEDALEAGGVREEVGEEGCGYLGEDAHAEFERGEVCGECWQEGGKVGEDEGGEEV